METFEYILFFLGIVPLIAYLVVIAILWELPKSFSATYYVLEEAKKNSGVLFTFVLWAYALTTMIVAAEPLVFLAGAGACFTGAASQFKALKMTKRVHWAGALVSIIGGLASVVVHYSDWPMLLIALASGVLLFSWKKGWVIRPIPKALLWGELMTMGTVSTEIFLNKHGMGYIDLINLLLN